MGCMYRKCQVPAQVVDKGCPLDGGGGGGGGGCQVIISKI